MTGGRINDGLYQSALILWRASQLVSTGLDLVDQPRLYPARVSRFTAWSLLAVFGIGVFLAGLELMITAIGAAVDPARPRGHRPARQARVHRAPPRVLDRQRLPARVRRRDAAGRPAGRPVGRPAAVPRRRSSSSSSARSWPAAAQTLDELIAGRIVQADRRRHPRPGRDRGRIAPVRGPRPAARARDHRRADVPRHGRRPVPRGGDPRRRSTPAAAWSASGVDRRPSSTTARARLALGLLRQRPDRPRRPRSSRGPRRAGWETPRRRGRIDVIGRVLFWASPSPPGSSA